MLRARAYRPSLVHALFVPDAGAFVPTDLARGPWTPDALHGGPVAALAGRALEHHEGGDGMQLLRLTLELVRPVPVAPLTVETRLTRPGRKVQLVEATVRAGGTEVCRAVGLRLRVAGVPVPERHGETLPGPEKGLRMSQAWGWQAFHTDGMEIRFVDGTFGVPGDATAWFRLRVPVVAGEEPSPFERAAAAADFGNGISSALPFEEWTFLNPDLTVSLSRHPRGEWVALQARTVLGDAGAALAESALHDGAGPFGRATQTLLVEPR